MKRAKTQNDELFAEHSYALVNEEQKREALAKTQRYIAASTERKVVSM
jgi:hypothetical protein